MRGILFAFLISSLSFQWVLSSLPFTCDNTLDLEYDPLVDSQFTTTYDLNFFYEMSSILIQVTKDENYDQSNVKGLANIIGIYYFRTTVHLPIVFIKTGRYIGKCLCDLLYITLYRYIPVCFRVGC